MTKNKRPLKHNEGFIDIGSNSHGIENVISSTINKEPVVLQAGQEYHDGELSVYFDGVNFDVLENKLPKKKPLLSSYFYYFHHEPKTNF